MGELDLLKKLHDTLLEHSRKLTFDKSHLWHRNLVALYGSLIELGGCLLILLNEGGNIGVPSIFRTFLETYVEVYNLLKDRKYGYHMQAQYNDQWLKLLKEASKGTNPYLEAMADVPNILQKTIEMEKELAELKAKGYKPLQIRDRFERAGMLDEYCSMYNMLCTDTHGNIRALISRHIEIKGADFEIVFYRDEPVEEFLSYIDAACGILVHAAIGIHELLGTEVLSEVRALENDLEMWRKKYVYDNSKGVEGKWAW